MRGKYAICSLLANMRLHMRSHVRYKLACLMNGVWIACCLNWSGNKAFRF